MTEREYRIGGREWCPLSDERLEAVLDDTGSDHPAGDYCAAEVYALAREVRALREAAEAPAPACLPSRSPLPSARLFQPPAPPCRHLWRPLHTLAVCRMCGIARPRTVAGVAAALASLPVEKGGAA